MVKRKAPPVADDGETGGLLDGALKPAKQAKVAADAAAFKNKEKVLLLSSRGITHRYILML